MFVQIVKIEGVRITSCRSQQCFHANQLRCFSREIYGEIEGSDEIGH
jgi:hypothetical protein